MRITCVTDISTCCIFCSTFHFVTRCWGKIWKSMWLFAVNLNETYLLVQLVHFLMEFWYCVCACDKSFINKQHGKTNKQKWLKRELFMTCLHCLLFNHCSVVVWSSDHLILIITLCLMLSQLKTNYDEDVCCTYIYIFACASDFIWLHQQG